MAVASKIRRQQKEARVRELVAAGKSTREIAAVLTEEDCKVGHVAVARFIREEMQERRDAARSVAAQEAQDSVPLVTQSLRDMVQIGMDEVRQCRGAPAQLAKMMQATTQACRALHAVTVGEEPGGAADVLETLREVVRRKQARD